MSTTKYNRRTQTSSPKDDMPDSPAADSGGSTPDTPTTDNSPAVHSSRKALDDFTSGKSKGLTLSRLTPEEFVEYIEWERKRRGLPELEDTAQEKLLASLRVSQFVQPDRPLPYNEYMAVEFPEPSDIVANGVVPAQGLVFAAGFHRSGKSLLITQLAICRSLGEPWLGYPTTPGRTLYINAEIMDRGFQRRLSVMARGGHIPSNSLVLQTVWGRQAHIIKDEGRRLIERYIEDVQPDLVILDPFYKLFGDRETNQDTVNAFLEVLDQWRFQYRCAIIVVHHFRKPQRDQRTGALFASSTFDIQGSSSLLRAPDSIIAIDGSPHATEATLLFDTRHDEKPDDAPIRRDAFLWYSLAGPSCPRTYRPILCIMRDCGPMTSKEITEHPDNVGGRSTTFNHIRDLSKLGFIERAGERVQITDLGREALGE